MVLGASSGALLVGWWLAWTVGFQRRNLLPAILRPLGSAWYRTAAGKYYVDEFYQWALIKPFLRIARVLSRFDGVVIDGAVNGMGTFGAWVSQVKAQFDRLVVDGLVNGVARTARNAGILLRRIQTGIIQQYLLVVVVSVVVLSLLLRR